MKRKSNLIEIPPEALAGRPIFADRPGDEIIEEIQDFIRESYAPHLWRGHTHTRPAKDEPFLYLGDYQLLKGREAPCPCCCPVQPKYWRKGVIVWFPREKVIRLVGGDCFKSMVGADAHVAAVRKLEEERRHKANIAIILRNADKLPGMISEIEKSLLVARAIDRFHSELHAGEIGKFVKGLRRHHRRRALH